MGSNITGRFGIRSLLCAILVIALGLGWFLDHQRQQLALTKQAQNVNQASYDYGISLQMIEYSAILLESPDETQAMIKYGLVTSIDLLAEEYEVLIEMGHEYEPVIAARRALRLLDVKSPDQYFKFAESLTDGSIAKYSDPKNEKYKILKRFLNLCFNEDFNPPDWASGSL